MEGIEITEPTGGIVIIKSKREDGLFQKYEAHHDPVTDDWQVVSDFDSQIQGQWLLSKSGAISFVLERIGVSPNAEYTMAPDRTSA